MATILGICRLGLQRQLSFLCLWRKHSLPSPYCHQRIRNCAIPKLDHLQSSQISLYVDTLLEWNQVMNLTAVTERSSVMDRHIFDSLALLPILEATYCKYNVVDMVDRVKVVDVGSGAGLPGIVLAIVRPSWEVTLMESIQKRCNFLEHAVQVLGLSNIKVVRARAEEAGQEKGFRETFDIAVARAVAEMRVLVELCLPLVRIRGLLVAAKGADPGEEVNCARRAAELLGGSILPIEKVASNSPHGQRTAVLCVKQKKTSSKYPRTAGTPQKRPL